MFDVYDYATMLEATPSVLSADTNPDQAMFMGCMLDGTGTGWFIPARIPCGILEEVMDHSTYCCASAKDPVQKPS